MGKAANALMRSLGFYSKSEVAEIAKGARESAMSEWRSLAHFLGIDPNIDGDAMGEATYYACTKILRETLGKLPLKLMRRMPNGGVVTAYDHPLYSTLCLRPNPYMTATSFWSAVEQYRNHTGNAYVRITGGNTRGDPPQLWLMPTSEVDVWWDDAALLDEVPDIYYCYSHGGRNVVLKSYEVMHFRSSDTDDGILGISLIDRLRKLVGGAIEAQGFQNELISSGLTAKAVLQYTSNLDDKAVLTFTSNMEKYAKGEFAEEGVKNIIPIPVGTTLQPLNTKLTDAQFEELKKYSAVQIASAFGIKPQQIGDMTKTSYASSQAQQEAFYTDTMLYILKDYENEVTYKALTDRMRGKDYFCEFDTSVMLRSDFKTTVEANKIAIESGQFTPNEARQRLKLPADPDGDVLLGNGNLIPIGMAGQQYLQQGSQEEPPAEPSGGGEANE